AAPFGENIVSAVKAGPTEVTMPLFVTDITDNGVVSGDPSAASPEAGRIIAEGSLCCAAPMASALRSSSFRRCRGARRWPAQAACDMDGKASFENGDRYTSGGWKCREDVGRSWPSCS